MTRFLALVAVAVLAAMPVAATERVSDFRLDNGLQLVVIEDHRAPVVIHMVWYRAGSADEQAGVSGVAHFLEHLLFKGTDTLESGAFSATVAANGGRDNAFTSNDYTAYYQRVAADRLALMMQMESDRMVNLRLGEAEILTERDVIIEERNQRVENSPGALMREQMDAAQYFNHRYGVPIIGWRHEMESLSLADALAYYRQYYAPNNAIVVVAGDVDPQQVLALAQTHYGDLPANPALMPRERPQEPQQTAPRRLVFEDARVSQPYLARTYLAPERDPGKQRTAAALTILAEILGGGTTSILTEKLQFDRQLAVYTSAHYRGVSLDRTVFGLTVVPAEGVSLQEAETAMDEVLADFLATGVDPAQLERIRRQVRAAQIYARDSVESLANRYGQALASGLTVRDVQDWPDLLQSVTEAEILAAARQVLDRRRSVTGWLAAPGAKEGLQ
ncbi:M16 family metallopeptidase [Shimia sp.]|uniref:M16 family metallopeptidase n=1 Tax=Shimia sp. TaxID=1954381 RepID=UPI003568C96F